MFKTDNPFRDVSLSSVQEFLLWLLEIYECKISEESDDDDVLEYKRGLQPLLNSYWNRISKCIHPKTGDLNASKLMQSIQSVMVRFLYYIVH
jgi:hypothetical protein